MRKNLDMWGMMAAFVVMLLMLCGCFTKVGAYTRKTVHPDGTITTESRCTVIGTGDKVAQAASEGLFADGTTEDLGAGVKKASASQQSSGIDGSLAALVGILREVNAIRNGTPGLIPSTPPTVIPIPNPDGDDDAGYALPTETAIAAATALKAKIAEAKASGKPLVVLAGDTGCSYCTTMDNILTVSPQFTGRTNIIFYRQTAPWYQNPAAEWTGPGNGKLPVLRVTQWDKDGKILCDKKVNRPQSVADIEAALTNCSVP